MTPNTSRTLLFLVRGVDLLRRGHSTDESEQALIASLAGLPPQFIQTRSHGRPVQPALRVSILSLRVPPQLQKHFDRKLLRAGGIPDNPCNDAGDALVLRAKDGLEIEPGLDCPHPGNSLARCVHKVTTSAEGEL